MELSVQQNLIESNLRLVPNLAKRMQWRLRPPMRRDDLISAGNLGLVRAARSFDPSRHTAFRSYAYKRVVGEMLDMLRNETPGGRKAIGANLVIERLDSDVHDAHSRATADYDDPVFDVDWGVVERCLPEKDVPLAMNILRDRMGYGEIGRRDGITKQAVSQRWWRIRERLYSQFAYLTN
jgi:RNA polymerase sigma factor (sigma-70 family)